MNLNFPINADSLIIILLGANLFFLLLFFIISIANSRRINKLAKKYNKFMELSGEGNIEKVLSDCITAIQELKEDDKEIRAKINDIERHLLKCIQKVAIERYCAFDNVGSDLSFAIALLDANNDGVTINSVYTRDGSTTYAKPISSGKSKYTLSTEEAQVLANAMKTQG